MAMAAYCRMVRQMRCPFPITVGLSHFSRCQEHADTRHRYHSFGNASISYTISDDECLKLALHIDTLNAVRGAPLWLIQLSKML
jgi:hypothetical protein